MTKDSAGQEKATYNPYVPPVAIAPPLMRFDDPDGKAVFFDPRYVTGVRDAQSTKIVSTIVMVSPPGGQGTSQIYIVVGRSENVGDRINMHRRGHGEGLEAGIADLKQRGVFEETDYRITSGKLVIPEKVFVHTEGAGLAGETDD